jgi:hypothetical protein
MIYGAFSRRWTYSLRLEILIHGISLPMKTTQQNQNMRVYLLGLSSLDLGRELGNVGNPASASSCDWSLIIDVGLKINLLSGVTTS